MCIRDRYTYQLIDSWHCLHLAQRYAACRYESEVDVVGQPVAIAATETAFFARCVMAVGRSHGSLPSADHPNMSTWRNIRPPRLLFHVKTRKIRSHFSNGYFRTIQWPAVSLAAKDHIRIRTKNGLNYTFALAHETALQHARKREQS